MLTRQQEAKKGCGMVAISYFVLHVYYRSISTFASSNPILPSTTRFHSYVYFEGGMQGAQIRETQALQLWQATRCYSTLRRSLKRPKVGFEVRMHRGVVLSIEVGPAGLQKVEDRSLRFGIPRHQLELPSSIVSFQRKHWRRIIISRCWKLKNVSNCRQRPTRMILAARD
jgi:hypothetical protein